MLGSLLASLKIVTLSEYGGRDISTVGGKWTKNNGQELTHNTVIMLLDFILLSAYLFSTLWQVYMGQWFQGALIGTMYDGNVKISENLHI